MVVPAEADSQALDRPMVLEERPDDRQVRRMAALLEVDEVDKDGLIGAKSRTFWETWRMFARARRTGQDQTWSSRGPLLLPPLRLMSW